MSHWLVAVWATVRRWAAGHRRDLAIVGLLAATAVVFALVARTPTSCRSFHTTIALGGRTEANRILAAECSALKPGSVNATLAADLVLALLYGGALFSAITRWWRIAGRTQLFQRLYVIRFVPLAAMALDLLENLTMWLGIRFGSNGAPRASWILWATVPISWWKLAFVSVALVATAVALAGAIGNSRTLPTASDPDPETLNPEQPASGSGICLSGGGIRAASFALGGLQGLDESGVFRGARFLSAVSGGAFTAAAWRIARRKSTENAIPTPQPNYDGILERARAMPRLFDFIRENRRYVSAGQGGLTFAVVAVASLLAFQLAILWLSLYVVSWPIGRFASSEFVLPQLKGCPVDAACAAQVERTLLLPVVVTLGLAALALGVSLGYRDRLHSRWFRIAMAFGLASAVSFIFLIGIPTAIAKGPAAFRDLSERLGGDSSASGAGWLGVLASLGIGGALIRMLFRPLSKTAHRLGGVFLVIILLLIGGWIAAHSAYQRGFMAQALPYFVAVGAFLLAGLMNQRHWSLHMLFLPRLRSTFATKQHPSVKPFGVERLPRPEEGTWSEYSEGTLDPPLPELLICAAAQRLGRVGTGVPAVSFVFSPKQVTLTDVNTEPDGRLTFSRYSCSTELYARTTARHLVTPSAAVAMSGAAFTSAMGRHGLGTTNALLAALNLRLGVWMPNPRYVPKDPQKVRKFKVPRLNYLAKELLGQYDLTDPYLYVTDGGHWENLGLVELIRRRCKWIFCVDASGDKPGEFGTLHEAITLARVECNATVDIHLDRLTPERTAQLPRDCVAIGVIRYHDGPDHTPDWPCNPKGCPAGVLVYAKSIVTPWAPLAIQAYALQDPRFPGYSTLDQFLSEAQFDRLVALGYSAAKRAALLSWYLGDALYREADTLNVADPIRAAYVSLRGIEFQP